MNDGKPGYTYNWFGLDRYTIESPVAIDSDKASIRLSFEYDGGGIGKGRHRKTLLSTASRSPRAVSRRRNQRSSRQMKPLMLVWTTLPKLWNSFSPTEKNLNSPGVSIP